MMEKDCKFSLLNYPQNNFVPATSVLFNTQGLGESGGESGMYSLALDVGWHHDIGRDAAGGRIYFRGRHISREEAYNMLDDPNDDFFAAAHWFESRRRLAELLGLDFENPQHYAMVTRMTGFITDGIHAIFVAELQSRVVEVQPGLYEAFIASNKINVMLNFRADLETNRIIVDATYHFDLLAPNYLPDNITRDEYVTLSKVIQSALRDNAYRRRVLSRKKNSPENERLAHENQKLEKLKQKINRTNIKNDQYKHVIFTGDDFKTVLGLLKLEEHYEISKKIFDGLENVADGFKDRKYLRGFEFTCKFILNSELTCVSIDIQDIAYNQALAKFFDRDDKKQNHFSDIIDTYAEHVFPRIISGKTDSRLRHLAARESLAELIASDRVKSFKIQKSKSEINTLIRKIAYLALLEFFYTVSFYGNPIAGFDAYLDNYFDILRKYLPDLKFDDQRSWLEELRIYASCLFNLYTQQRVHLDGPIKEVYQQRDTIYHAFKALKDYFSSLDVGGARVMEIASYLRNALLANLEERSAWAHYLDKHQKSYDAAPIDLFKGPGASITPSHASPNVFLLDLHRVYDKQQALLHAGLTKTDSAESIASVLEAFEKCKQYHQTYFPSGVTQMGLSALEILTSSLVEEVKQCYALSDIKSSALPADETHVEEALEPTAVQVASLPKLVTIRPVPKQTEFHQLCHHLKEELNAYLESSGNGWFWSRSRKISRERRHTAELLLALADAGIELERAGELNENDKKVFRRIMYDLKILHKHDHAGLFRIFSWTNRLGNALERVLTLPYMSDEVQNLPYGRFESPMVSMTLAEKIKENAGVKKLRRIDGEHVVTEYDNIVGMRIESSQNIIHQLRDRRFAPRLLDCDPEEEFDVTESRSSLLTTLEKNKDILNVKSSWIKGLRNELEALKKTKEYMIENEFFTGPEGSLKSDHCVPILFFTYRQHIDQLIKAVNDQRVVKVVQLLQTFPRNLLLEKSAILKMKLFPASCDMYADTALFDLLNQAVRSLEEQQAMPQVQPYNHKQCVFPTGAAWKNEGQFKEALQFLQEAFTLPNAEKEETFEIKQHAQERMGGGDAGMAVDSPRLRAVERLVNPKLTTPVSEAEQKFADIYQFIDRQDVNISELKPLLAANQYPALVAYLADRGLDAHYAVFMKAYFDNITVAEAQSAYTKLESERLAAEMASSVITAAVSNVVTLPSRLDAVANQLASVAMAEALAEVEDEQKQQRLKSSASPEGLFGRTSASGSRHSSSTSSLDKVSSDDEVSYLFEYNRTDLEAKNRSNSTDDDQVVENPPLDAVLPV